jgi:hypothetical protein
MHEEYGGENSSKHPPQARTDDITASIGVNNDYFAIANENSQRIVEILTNNYALIEPEDAEILGQFRLHHLRHKTEFDESGRLKVPYDVYKHVGDIYSLDPAFAALVNRRFKEKKAELGRLLR